MPPVTASSWKDLLHRLLRGEVDCASRRASAKEHRGRPEEDLDTAEIEGVSGVPAEVTHAVAADVRLRREAAEDEGVSLASALPRADRDARDVAQGLSTVVAFCSSITFFGDHGDGLRRVD